MSNGVSRKPSTSSTQRNTSVGFNGEGKEKAFQDLKSGMDKFLGKLKDSTSDDKGGLFAQKFKKDLSAILGLKKTGVLATLNPTSGKHNNKALSIFTREILHRLEDLNDMKLTNQVLHELKKINGDSPVDGPDRFLRVVDTFENKQTGFNPDSIKGKLITVENRDLFKRIEEKNNKALRLEAEIQIEIESEVIMSKLKRGEDFSQPSVNVSEEALAALTENASKTLEAEARLLQEFGVKPVKLYEDLESDVSHLESKFSQLSEENLTLRLIDEFDS